MTTAATTEQAIVDELVYRSYAYNRERFPEIKTERWVTIYPDAAAMEKRYQESINRYADTMIRRDKDKPAWLRAVLTGAKEPQ